MILTENTADLLISFSELEKSFQKINMKSLVTVLALLGLYSPVILAVSMITLIVLAITKIKKYYPYRTL